MSGGQKQRARILQASMADATQNHGQHFSLPARPTAQAHEPDCPEPLQPFDPRAELLHGLWIVPLFLMLFAAVWIMTP